MTTTIEEDDDYLFVNKVVLNMFIYFAVANYKNNHNTHTISKDLIFNFCPY